MGLAERATAARDHDIDGGLGPMPAVKAAFHVP
jgi:hypothetical protein